MSRSDIYVIAEIGNNHQGSLQHALDLMKAAKSAGANAVKTQKRDNKNLYTENFFNQPYDNPNSFAKTYGEHREKLELKKNDYVELCQYAKELKIDFFATPFDLNSLEFLEQFNMPAYKLASADILNTMLIREVAKTKKNIFLSTGGATINDIHRAKDLILEFNNNLSILQCTASYPADVEDMNLNVLKTFQKEFPGIRLGLSDHENGIDAGPLAYMLGARVFEKHFTLNRANKGTDNAFSLEPQGLEKFVRNLHRIDKMLGSEEKKLIDKEKKPLDKMRKSPVLIRSMKKGEKIFLKDIALKSPGLGLPAYEFENLIGKTLKIDLPIETYLEKDHIKD